MHRKLIKIVLGKTFCFGSVAERGRVFGISTETIVSPLTQGLSCHLANNYENVLLYMKLTRYDYG